MSRPLLSQLIPSAEKPLQATPKSTIDISQDVQNNLLNTPQRGSQIYQLVYRAIEPHSLGPTARQLFRKIRKGMDNKNLQLVNAERKIQDP